MLGDETAPHRTACSDHRSSKGAISASQVVDYNCLNCLECLPILHKMKSGFAVALM
jgi:hypothetical protein